MNNFGWSIEGRMIDKMKSTIEECSKNNIY